MALPSALASASGVVLPPNPSGLSDGAGRGISIHSCVIGLQSVNGAMGRWYTVNFQINNDYLPETHATGVVVKIYALIEGSWTAVYTTPTNSYGLGGGFGGATYVSSPTPDPPGNWRAVVTASDLPVVTGTASFSGVY